MHHRVLGGALAALLLLTACSGGQAAPAPPPADSVSGVGDPLFPLAGNGGYDVSHYGLVLDYEPATGLLRGTAKITARATRQLPAFNLDLSGLTVGTVTVDGAAAKTSRAGTELTVRPAHAVARGAAFIATVEYSGVPSIIKDDDGSHEGWIRTDDGAVALGEPVGSMTWFPGNNHPSDKAAYDIAVTVPAGLTAVSNGELTATRTSGGRSTFQWHSAEPMASYLTTVAIGHFQVTQSHTASGLPVYVAVDPREAGEDRSGVLRKIPEILDWESALFGPYPFSSTGAIVDRVDREVVGYALENQTKPVFPGDTEGTTLDEPTLVHELAHQWFGDSVTPRTWQGMWLNEGFATYTEWLWDEQHGGDSVQKHFDTAYADDAQWEFPPADPGSAENVSDAPVYGRGAMVLHKVRQAVGDKDFFTILRTWAVEHRHGNVNTAEFTAWCEKHSGKNLSGLFAAWLYGDGRPKTP
ncbi:M1 family metallopeptidase [Streptomyces sp. H10-C2]|uniref:M1 family metallopeptidase n=1 Tax=unclassified Streptomyces TaxID=2593676 RepID=UPI0024BACF0E|nr:MULTISPECIES: M1 family metallopeptidase [unclassified Streptomyces]MDJ0345932.1 M1 family metallopeptidase [Streptomyces sp. PH10-H1]MDJ0374781.1 M1 family metallopeptidase [Streptomyces sp. H10-C2]